MENDINNIEKHYTVREISDLRDMLRQSVSSYGKNPAFLQKLEEGGSYIKIDYLKFMSDINSLGTRLLDMGLKDKNIAVIGANCYHYVLAYYAIVCGIGTAVPIDKELSGMEINDIIRRTDCKAVFCDEESKAKIDSSLVENLFEMKQYPNGTCDIDVLIKDGKALINDGNIEYMGADIDPDKMSMMLFTSGTTGDPKGVMLNHRNIVSNIMDVCKIVKIYPQDRTLSVLPIHLAYESTINIAVPLYSGASIAFCEGDQYVSRNFKESGASILVTVPLMAESIYKKLFDKVSRHQTAGKLRLIVSGAAAMDPKVVRGFGDLGIKALQGYGLTECSPLVAGTPDFENTYRKAGSVGPAALSGDIEIRDRNDEGIGEIVYKGPNVMMGYYKDEKATGEIIKNGWLHTGDLGFIDEKGWLYITGRKKNVIVTKSGKNIYPEEIEAFFLENKFIGEIMIYGAVIDDGLGSDTIIAAKIRPDVDAVNEEFGDKIDEETLYDLMKNIVSKMNKDMPDYKRIKNLIVRKGEFTRTATKKVKRHLNI